MSLKRLNVYLEPEQIEQLKALAQRRRTSASALVIEAVRHLLRNPSFYMPPSSSETVDLTFRSKEDVA